MSEDKDRTPSGSDASDSPILPQQPEAGVVPDAYAAPGAADAAVPQQPPAPYVLPPQPPAPAPGQQPCNPYGQPVPAYCQQPIGQQSGKATGALVCGILAILFAWLPLVGIVLGIVAIVLAVKASKEAGKDGKATGAKVCGAIGIVLSVIAFVMFLVLGVATLAYVADHPSSVSVTTTPDQSADNLAQPDEEKVRAVAIAELDKLKNADPAVVQYLAAASDSGFTTGAGYSLTELGIDPTELAKWMLAGFDYQIDDVYVYESDGLGTVYADVTMRDVYALARTYYTDVQAYVDAADMAALDEAAVKAKLGELFNAAMAKTTDVSTNSTSIDVIKKGNTWVADDDAWNEEMGYLFDLY